MNEAVTRDDGTHPNYWLKDKPEEVYKALRFGPLAEAEESYAACGSDYPDVVANVVEECTGNDRFGCTQTASSIVKEHREWLWPGFLGLNKVVHFGGASTEGKSPVTLDIAARVSAGLPWPDGSPNNSGPRSVISWLLKMIGPTPSFPVLSCQGRTFVTFTVFLLSNRRLKSHRALIMIVSVWSKKQIGDVALVVIDPITNYLGSKKMNAEEEIRGGILMPYLMLLVNTMYASLRLVTSTREVPKQRCCNV